MYRVIHHAGRWLVVRQVPGTDYASVVADCRTEQAARGVADDFNAAQGGRRHD